MKKAIIMDVDDNVCMALDKIVIDDVIQVILAGNIVDEVTVKEDVDIYHKIALNDIENESDIVKYGEVIGKSTKKIKRGEHVHVHNIRSLKV